MEQPNKVVSGRIFKTYSANRLFRGIIPVKFFLFLTVFFFWIGVSDVRSQILTFEFSALAGDEATANSNSNDANLSSSTISRGAGLTASANTGRYNATAWATGSIANAVSGNNYMQFTITPNAGYQFSVSSIVIQLQRSGTGHTAIALRNSLDSYAANLDAQKSVTDNTSTQTFTFTFTQNNSSSAVSYRLYGYAEAAGGSGGPGDDTGNDIVVNGSVTATSAPDIALSSANPSVAAGNVTQGATNSAIYKFTTGITTANATLSQLDFTTSGTYAASDLDNFKLYYHTADNFGAASQIGSTITTSLGAGSHSFTGLTQVTNSGATGYFWITASVDVAATAGNTITVSAITTSNLTYAAGNKSGSASAGGTQTIISGSSSASDVIEASFDEPDNISYSSYQTTNITDGSPTTGAIKVGSFILRDGGGASDGDSYTTQLTDIAFSVSNSSNLRRLALYDGTTELSEIAASGTATFTGLTITATDNSSKTFDIYASFQATVTDNQQFQFTVTSVTANGSGSGFAAGNGGGATTSVTGDDNKIEVTATALAFVQQPSNTNINAAMSPAVTVKAVDANNNTDLDFVTDIKITSTGTLAGTPVSSTPVSGVATFSTLTHTATGTNLNLTAERSGTNDWDAVSNTFDITNQPVTIADFTFNANPYLQVTTADANVSVTNVSLSSGAIETNITTGTYFTDEPYVEETGGWDQVSQGAAKYFTFTITADATYEIEVTNISFEAYATSAGPSAFSFDIDGTDTYTTNAPDASLVTVNETVSGVTGQTEVIVKVQGWLNGSRSSGGTGVFRLDNVTVDGFVTIIASPPTLTTDAVSAITSSTATGGGNITATGGADASTRGVCWDVYANPDPDISDSKTTENGTFSTGTFSGQSITGLSAETRYKARAYATNVNGTGYGTAVDFWSLSAEPAAHAASFTSSAISASQIDLSFSAATTISNADGYIILRKNGASAPTGTPTNANAYSVGNSIGDGTVVAITNSSATTASITGLSGNTQYSFTLIPFNYNGTETVTYNYRTSATIPSTTATTLNIPEINIKQGTTSYATGATYDFGNAAWGSNNDVVFTIENTGTTDLTISNTNVTGTGFSLQAGPSSPVAGAGSTTFTIRLTPNALGAFSGSVTVTNNDANEGSYVINFTGTGIPSATSDIIANASYSSSYNSNLAYASYQIATITNTSNSLDLFKFDLRDGGGSADADNLPTILSAVTFNVTNIANIRTAALFNGNALVNASPTINTGAGTIAFSGLSGANVTATDGSTNSLTLRVSFLATVTDNHQFQVTIANANTTAAGSNTSSLFAAFSSVVSSTTGDRNRIEVTATTIAWGTQPDDCAVASNMTAFTIKAVDALGNTDLDNSTCTVALTTSGTGLTSSSPYTFSSGLITVSTAQFSVVQTGITITATAQSCLGSGAVVSNSFDVSGIVYAPNDYRSATGTGLTWSDANDWQMFDGTNWGSFGDDGTPSTTRDVFIQGAMSTNGSRTADEITILDGGTLTISGSSTVNTYLLVMDGGNMQVNAGLTCNGTFEVEDGGTVVLNYELIHGNSAIWDGTELFHPNSTFVITNWSVNNATTGNRAFFNGTNVSTNTFNGYTAAFGNIELDVAAAVSNHFVFMNDNATGLNLAHGDLLINNPPLNYNASICTGCDITSGIGGSVIVDAGFESDEYFIFSNSGDLTFEILGDLQVAGATAVVTASSNAGDLTTVNIHGDISVTGSASLNFSTTAAGGPPPPQAVINLDGDISVASAGLLVNSNTSTKGNLNFTGVGDGLSAATTQTIDIASTGATENRYIVFNVTSGSYVEIVNQDFELGTNSVLNILDDGVLDFGFDGSDNPLHVKLSGAQTGASFDLDQGGTLKITSPDGISDGSVDVNTGNVKQIVTSNRTFDQTAIFWYIGKTNQVTGNAITTGSTGKQVIVELDNNTITLTPSNILQVSNGTAINATGGKLDIRKGIFQETTTEYFSEASGTLYMTDGEYRIPRNSADASDIIPRMTGATYAYSLTGGTVVIEGTGDQYLRGSRAYYNIQFTGSGGMKRLSGAIQDIAGTVTIDDANIVDTETNSFGNKDASNNNRETDLVMSAGTFRIGKASSGTYPQMEGVYNITGGTIVLYGTTSGGTPQFIRTDSDEMGATPVTYYNLQLDAVSADIGYGETNIGMDGDCNVDGVLTLNSPTVLTLHDNDIFYEGAGVGSANFTMNAGATLLFGHSSGLKLDGSDGNIQVDGTITLPSDENYGAVSSGTLATNDMPTTVKNFYIFRTNSTQIVSLTQSTTVTEDVVFGAGKVQLDNRTLTVDGDITGYSSSNYFITLDDYNSGAPGLLIRSNVGTTETVFPVGYNSTSYSPMTIVNDGAGGPKDFSVRVFSGVYEHGTSGSLMETPIANFVNRTWQIEPEDQVNVDATVKLMWNTAEEGTSFDRTLCKMVKNTGGPADEWTEVSVAEFAATFESGTMYSIEESGITSFSRFGIGDGQAPLPVTLLDLAASQVDVGVSVTWQTASEINNDYYNVLRSADGVRYEEISLVDGAGTSFSTTKYEFIDDAALTGTIYYKLGQTDFDGTYTEFGPVAVNIDGSGKVSVWFDENDLVIIVGEERLIEVNLYDVSGRSIGSWQGVSGRNILYCGLPAGVYFACIKGDVENRIKLIKTR